MHRICFKGERSHLNEDNDNALKIPGEKSSTTYVVEDLSPGIRSFNIFSNKIFWKKF